MVPSVNLAIGFNLVIWLCILVGKGKDEMEFNVGLIHGENFRFAARIGWPSTKLTVDSGQLTLTTGFDSVSFQKKNITRLSEYPGFCWLFARGIRIEHDQENHPQFLVFWMFDFPRVKRCLTENGFVLIEPAEDE